jgi:Tol biopolymer transport system component
MHRHDAVTNKGDLWILELDRNQTTRLTFDGNHNFAPIWSPDGTRVVYASARKGNTNDLYQKLANGAAGEDLLLESADSKHPDDWSRDGRYILYESSTGAGNSDLFVLPTFGDKKPIPFANTPFVERKGRFSPDGKWIAYTSNESGADQVYIQPFPPNGGKWQISTKGGFEPRWRSDGKELYYINSTVDPKILGVGIKWTSIPEPGPPQELVSLPVASYGVDDANQYVASADGQKFLTIRDIRDTNDVPGSGTIMVLINWLANLRQ